MQYEVKRQPGNNSSRPVTGFPSQQKAQQRPGDFGRGAASKNTGPSQVARPDIAYKKPGNRPQSLATSTQRPSFGYTSAAKSGQGNQTVQPGFRGANANRFTGRYPVGGAAKNGTFNNGYAPGKAAGRFNALPQATPSAYGKHFPAQAVGSVNYQPSYVFSPAPDIPPKLPAGNGGNTIPNPGKTPDDFPDKQPCTCGQTGNGCTTLNRFAVGSAVITPAHKQQIALLAQTILQTNVKAITTTGHTDVTGSDENNMYLGNERSRAVRKELRDTLHRLKPWSPTAIYFRTDTKGESEPVSDTDDGLNRRVEVCLNQTI